MMLPPADKSSDRGPFCLTVFGDFHSSHFSLARVSVSRYDFGYSGSAAVFRGYCKM